MTFGPHPGFATHLFQLPVLAIGWLIVVLADPTGAAFAATDSAVEDALGRTPWYDPQGRGLLPVEVETNIDDTAHRDSRWLPQPDRVAERPASSAGTTGGGGLFGSGFTIGNLVGWAVLATLLIVIVALLAYAFSKLERGLETASSVNRSGPGTMTDEQMIERAKHLPSELRRTDVNLRDEAARLMETADFDQALILLFGHQLLLLDQSAIVRLSRGKTNGRYLRETAAVDRDLGERLSMTVAAFERSYFGSHPVTASEFDRLWENNTELEQSLQTRREAVA